MAYYEQKQTRAWWDPDEVSARTDDAMTTDAERKRRAEAWLNVALAPLALLAFASSGPRRTAARPRLRADQPERETCRSCGPRRCPILDRSFACVGGSPGGLTYQCSRCGETFKILGGDNPADFHSC